MSSLWGRSRQENHKSNRVVNDIEVISEDMQDVELQPELPRAVSMQRILMRSKSRADEIVGKEYGERRGSLTSSISVKGKHLLKSRTQSQKVSKSRTAGHLRQSDNVKEPDLKRPISVTLPYISTTSPSRNVVDVNRNHQRTKSLYTEKSDSGESYKFLNLKRRSTKAIEPASITDSETKEFHSFPVDKEERARVEHSFSSVELSPVSCTYVMMLEENPPVSMKLRNHGLSAKSVSILKTSLDNNNNIRELDLEGNALNDIGVEDLGIMLRGNMCIEQLNISSNTFSSKGVIAIGHLLESNKTLRSISLSRNKLTDTDLELLCSSMEDTDNNLETVDLSFNSFTPEAGHTIGRFLSVSRKLKDLKISGNNFGALGIRPILEGLRENYTLKKLDIAFNEISDRGMKVLGGMQSLGKALTSLDLSDNFITFRGIKHFVPVLESNTSLTVLKLDNNQIGTNGLKFLLECILLRENDSLSQLHVRGVFANQSIKKLCDEIRKLNSKFVLFGVTRNSSSDPNDALEILQIYLRNNKIIASERSERIGAIDDIEI